MIDCSKKRRLPSAKLVDSQVAYIKRLCAAGYTNSQIGRWYQVHRTTILDIRREKYWGHVEPSALIPFVCNQQEAVM